MTLLPPEIEQLWKAYREAEGVRIRSEVTGAMERFISALLGMPDERWRPWAFDLAMRFGDARERIPLRMPLFRKVLFPALIAGMKASVPGSARCLAGFSHLLYHSPDCRAQLPEMERTEFGLLKRALRDDPSDSEAKQRLVEIMRDGIEYALHELPWCVLFGHDAANIDQCAELRVDLDAFEGLTKELGVSKDDAELIAEARLHFSAFPEFLQQKERYADYSAFLAKEHPSLSSGKG